MTIQRPFVVEPLNLGIIATGNEKINRLASNLNRLEDQGMIWETAGSANIWARGDFGVDRDVNFVGLISTNASAATTCRLRLGDTQAEVDAVADYDSQPQLIRSPAVEHWAGRYHWYWELPTIQSKRWWRIDINNHAGVFNSMALVMGKRLQFADFYNHSNGVSFGIEDMGSVDFGQFGVDTVLDGIKMRTLNMEFGWMNPSNKREFQDLSERLGDTKLAYWCFDGEATIDRQRNQYLGWLRKPMFFSPTTFAQNRFGTQADIVSII